MGESGLREREGTKPEVPVFVCVCVSISLYVCLFRRILLINFVNVIKIAMWLHWEKAQWASRMNSSGDEMRWTRTSLKCLSKVAQPCFWLTSNTSVVWRTMLLHARRGTVSQLRRQSSRVARCST